MASIVAFSLSCLVSYFAMSWQVWQHSKTSNDTIFAPSPLPSPAEGALSAEIAAPSVHNIESFPTTDLPVHALEVASSSLEASSSTFPYALVVALVSLISCFLYFGYLFSDSDPTGAIQYGEYLLEASIDDLEQGPQATHVEPLDTDQAEDKHQLDRSKLTVDSLKKAGADAQNSEADAKAAAEKARSELSSVQAELDHVKSSLAATSEQRDKAHSLVSEISGENEQLAELHTALQEEIDSLKNELDTTRQNLTHKVSEAAQARAAKLDSVTAENIKLMGQNTVLVSENTFFQTKLRNKECELTSMCATLGNERKLHASGRDRVAKQKEEHDAVLARCESLEKLLGEKTVTNTEDLQECRRSLESELAVVQELNEELEKQWEAGRNKLQSGAAERQGLRDQLNSAHNDLASVQEEFSALTEANDSLKEKNLDLKKQVQQAEACTDRVIEEVDSKHMDMGQNLATAQTELDSLREENSKLRNSQQPGTQQLEELQKLTDQVDEINEKLLDAELQNEFLIDARDERDSVRRELEELRSSAQQDNDELGLLQNEVEKLKKKLEDAESLHEADQAQLEKLQSQLTDIRAKYCELVNGPAEDSERADEDDDKDKKDDDDENDNDDDESKGGDGNAGVPHSEEKDQDEDGGSQPDEGEDEDAPYADDDDDCFYGSHDNDVSAQEEKEATQFNFTAPNTTTAPIPASGIPSTNNGSTMFSSATMSTEEATSALQPTALTRSPHSHLQFAQVNRPAQVPHQPFGTMNGEAQIPYQPFGPMNGPANAPYPSFSPTNGPAYDPYQQLSQPNRSTQAPYPQFSHPNRSAQAAARPSGQPSRPVRATRRPRSQTPRHQSHFPNV